MVGGKRRRGTIRKIPLSATTLNAKQRKRYGSYREVYPLKAADEWLKKTVENPGTDFIIRIRIAKKKPIYVIEEAR